METFMSTDIKKEATKKGPLTSFLVKYNNNFLGTYKKFSEKSKNYFYSLVVPTADDNLIVSFVLATKFVFQDKTANLKNGTLGNQNIYIIKE